MQLNEKIRVVAAVIERDGRFLVCQRPAHKRHGGLWEFPGGKLEQGESLPEAARRELAEELGVEVQTCGELLFAIGDPDSPFLLEFHPVSCAGEPACLEHAALAWASLADLERLDLAPGDRRFAQWLQAERG